MENSISYNSLGLTQSKTTFNIRHYNSVDLFKIREYLNNLDSSYFKYLKITEDSKIEKICLDYYDNTNYYDLVMFINGRDQIYGLTYSNDVILSAVEKDIEQYRNKVFKDSYKNFSKTAKEKLYKQLEGKYNYYNSKYKLLKVIDKDRINTVISDINTIIESYQNNVELLDL